MTALPKSVYFDVLVNIVDKYNNMYHNIVKMKSINVKPNSYAEYNVNSNDKDTKFNKADRARVSKYKNILLKDMFLIGQKKFL